MDRVVIENNAFGKKDEKPVQIIPIMPLPNVLDANGNPMVVGGGVGKGGIKVPGKVTGKETAKTAENYFGQDRKYWSAEPVNINGNKVYQRNDLFDPTLVTTWRDKGKVITGTNIDRMASGRAPIGKDGKSINLHHMTQSQTGPIAEVTQTFHQKNSAVIHINPNTVPSGINRAEFDKWKSQYWQQRVSEDR